MNRLIPAVLAAGAISAAAPSTLHQQENVTAFVNVSVIPMDRERVLTGQTVLVRGSRIAEVGAANRVRIPAGATRVDGTGRWLIPGLAEMHAHVQPSDQPAAVTLNERILLLYVAHGVTTVRGMLGHPAQIPLRERVNRGEIVGPTMRLSSPSFNGNSAGNWQAAQALVRSSREGGFDFLKIHPGIPREAFDSLAAEADRLGIRMAGHVPLAVGAERAVTARYWSIDHLDGIVEYLAGLAPGENGGFFGLTVAPRADLSRLPALIAGMRRNNVWVVPTQSLIEHFLTDTTAEEMAQRAEMRLVPQNMVTAWTNQRRNLLQQMAAVEMGNRLQYFALRRRILGELHRAGIGIALGSDAPQTFMVPGFSVRGELRTYVEAGMSPWEALATGTRNIARFLGTERETGTIERGKVADLVLLDANPLQDINNLHRQAGVMVRGLWLDRAELERRLAL
jgi:hypothetical protein